MSKLYLTANKEWLLKNYPKMTLKELCDNKMIQDKPFIEQTGEPIYVTLNLAPILKNNENWKEEWETDTFCDIPLEFIYP